MAWPISQDYNEAIQNARTCLADAELRAGQPVLNPLGLPLPRSGNFADVYEFDCPSAGKRWAVKCFTREVPGLQERYAAIGQHLAVSKPSFMVDFQYLPQGIRVRGRWYPILKMRWVEGLLLSDFARQYCHKPALMDKLGELWLKMAARLGELKIGHGDLQHGNVILVAAEQKDHALKLRLIDYDGMYIPALRSRPSGEVGHAAFQHPERGRTRAYGPDVDRFSVLLVATAMRALVIGGRSLWQRYDNGDNLLFRAADLAAPGQSALFKELCQSDDGATRALADRLYQSCAGPLAAVPGLDKVLAALPSAPRAPSASLTMSASHGAPSRRRMALWSGVLVAGVLGALGIVMTVLNKDEPRPEQPALTATNPQEPPARRADVVLDVPSVEPAAPSAEPERVPPVPPPATRPEAPMPIAPKDVVKEPTKPKAPPSPPAPATEEAESPKLQPAPVPKATRTAPATTAKTDAAPSPKVEPRAEPPLPATPKRPPPPVEPAPAPVAASPPDPTDLFAGQGPQVGEVCRLKGHTGQVRRLAVSPDGRRLLSAAWDSTVRLWDLPTRKEVAKRGGLIGNAVAFLPDGQHALGCSDQGGLSLWHVATGEEKRSFTGHKENVLHLAVSPDGKLAVSASTENVVFLWDLEAGSERKQLKADEGGVDTVAFSPDGRLAVAGTSAGAIIVWEAATAREIGRLSAHERHVTGFAFSADSRQLYSCGRDLAVRRWDIERGQELLRLQGSTASVNAIGLAPEGGRMLAAGADGHLRGWDFRVPALLLCDFTQEQQIWDVVFARDGRYAYSASADHDIHVWRLPPSTRGKTLLSKMQNLTEKDGLDARRPGKRCKVETGTFEAGKRYVVELTAGTGTPGVDPLLRIEDKTGKVLAEDNDSGGQRNARIVFTAPSTGVYRVVAANAGPSPVAAFMLIITEEAGR